MSKRAWGSAVQNREEQFDLKRTAVLHTAARLIRERGYQNVSLVDIAAALHISKPAIYYYFKSKGDLVRELFALATGAFLDPLDHPEDYPVANGLSGAMQMERFVRRAARIVVDDVGSTLVTLPAGSVDVSLMKPSNDAVRALAENIMRTGIADGSLAPCDVEASYHFIVGALRHLPTWFAPRDRSLGEVSDSLVRFVLRGLEPGRS